MGGGAVLINPASLEGEEIDRRGRANVVAVYRIRPYMMSGRKTV